MSRRMWIFNACFVLLLVICPMLIAVPAKAAYTVTLYSGANTTAPAILYDPGAGHYAVWGNILCLESGRLLQSMHYDSTKAILYYSDDSGTTWASLYEINPSSGAGSLLQRSNGDVWIIYNLVDGALVHLWYRVSSDDGNNWGAAIRVLPGDDSLIAVIHGKPIQLSNGEIFIPAFQYTTEYDGRCLAVKYNFTTETWSKYFAAGDGSPTSGYSEWTAFEGAGGRIVGLLRHDKDIHVMRVYSDDDGVTWSAPTDNYVTDNDPTGYWQTSPEALKVGNFTYMTLWHRRFTAGPDPPECRIVVSTDDGLTWANYTTTVYAELIAGGHGGGASIARIGSGDFIQTFHFNVGTTGKMYQVRYGGMSVDGAVQRHGVVEPWATITTGVGTASGYGGDSLSIYAQCSVTPNTDNWTLIARSLTVFDTSLIPDVATVTEAIFSVYGNVKLDQTGATPDLNIYGTSSTSNITVVNTDYENALAVPFCDVPVTYAGFNIGVPGVANSWILNTDGLAAVDVTGVTRLVIRNANYDASGVAPSWITDKVWYLIPWSADKGPGYKPTLVVSYTLPGPVLTTLAVTDASMGGGTFATLNGNLADLSSSPTVDVWFEWGYDTSYGNTSLAQNTLLPGDFSTDISGFDPNEDIVYRFVGRSEDGTTAYGAPVTFRIQDGAATAYRLLYGVGLVVIASAILIGVFLTLRAGGPVAGLIAAIIGLLAFTIAEIWLRSLW